MGTLVSCRSRNWPRRGGITRGDLQCVLRYHGLRRAGPGSLPLLVVLFLLLKGDNVAIIPPACLVVAKDLLLSRFLGHIGVDSACLLIRFEHNSALQIHRLLRYSWIKGLCSIALFLFIFAVGFCYALTRSTSCRIPLASTTVPPGSTMGGACLVDLLPLSGLLLDYSTETCLRLAQGGKISPGLLAVTSAGTPLAAKSAERSTCMVAIAGKGAGKGRSKM